MPTYRYKNYKVIIGQYGEIHVARGDTISGYCAAIYQTAPGSTKHHWGEFGRKDSRGALRPLKDPNRIAAGETLYHLPSVGKNASTKKIDANLISIKLHRLKRIREDGIELYDNIHRELLAQKKKVDNFSLGLDMAGVIAGAVGAGWFKVGKALKAGAAAADDLTKELLKRTWGVGLQPQNQGVVQGVGQNLLNSGDNLQPADDDHTVVAMGKILVSSFIDMTSPSYWSKRMAGGDPKDELNRAIAQNARNREAFLLKVDKSIRQHEAILMQHKAK